MLSPSSRMSPALTVSMVEMQLSRVVFPLPDAHQVSWFIGGHLRADVLQNTVHVFLRLTNRQTADSVAIKANLYQTFHRDIA